jgi:hypothetical protein
LIVVATGLQNAVATTTTTLAPTGPNQSNSWKLNAVSFDRCRVDVQNWFAAASSLQSRLLELFSQKLGEYVVSWKGGSMFN